VKRLHEPAGPLLHAAFGGPLHRRLKPRCCCTSSCGNRLLPAGCRQRMLLAGTAATCWPGRARVAATDRLADGTGPAGGSAGARVLEDCRPA
jgi:hypothetical protein